MTRSQLPPPSSFGVIGRYRAALAILGPALLCAAVATTDGVAAQRAELPDMHDRFMTNAGLSAIEIGFDMGIGYKSASMRAANMTFFYDPEHPEETTATALLEAGTFSSGEPAVDEALKSPDWLDVENHERILFHSSGVGEDADGAYLAGNLTIKGTTAPIRLYIDHISEVMRDPASKNDFVHFKGHTTIKRSDFGLGRAPMWNEPIIGGLWRIGDNLHIEVHITGYSFTPEHLEQMFRAPRDDGAANPVGSIYDATLADGVAAGIAEYDRLREAYPGEVDHLTLSNAAWYVMLTADADDAVALFERSIADAPDETMTYLRQGDAYVFAGQPDKAIANYRSMWDHYPTLPHIPEMLRLLGVNDPLSQRPGASGGR